MAETKRPWDPADPSQTTPAKKSESTGSRRDILRGVAVTAGAITTGALTARGAVGQTPDGPTRPRFPHAFHGVSLAVTNIDRAIWFYERVLGATVLVPRTIIASDDESVEGLRLAAISGGKARRGVTASLAFANGVGLELYELGGVDEDASAATGPLHLMVTDPDVDAFVAEVERVGGTRLTRTLVGTAGAGDRRSLVRDPFGVTLEVVSQSFEQARANIA